MQVAGTSDRNNAVFFRPLWASDGFISKKMLESECEKLCGSPLTRKRKLAVIMEDSEVEEANKSASTRRDRESSRSSRKRRRIWKRDRREMTQWQKQ